MPGVRLSTLARVTVVDHWCGKCKKMISIMLLGLSATDLRFVEAASETTNKVYDDLQFRLLKFYFPLEWLESMGEYLQPCGGLLQPFKMGNVATHKHMNFIV